MPTQRSPPVGRSRSRGGKGVEGSCGGGGKVLLVPSVSTVFGDGVYGLETTVSAVTTSGIRRSPKTD